MDGQMDGQTDRETATLNAAPYREGRTFDHVHTANERYVRYATDRQTDRQIPRKHIIFAGEKYSAVRRVE